METIGLLAYRWHQGFTPDTLHLNIPLQMGQHLAKEGNLIVYAAARVNLEQTPRFSVEAP